MFYSSIDLICNIVALKQTRTATHNTEKPSIYVCFVVGFSSTTLYALKPWVLVRNKYFNKTQTQSTRTWSICPLK